MKRTLIAETNEQFKSFSPYVASINNGGTVAFQSTLANGGAGIFSSSGGLPIWHTESMQGLVSSFDSHPDINNDGALSFYATLDTGAQGVFVIRDGQWRTVAKSGAGPLGPTMNDSAQVAFRCCLHSQHAAICVGSGDAITTIADTANMFDHFHGLPVINSTGAVVFCADMAVGGQGLYSSFDGQLSLIADTSGIFGSLGAFPVMNDTGSVAFCAPLKAGGTGIYKVKNGQVTTIADTSGPFESFRGVLVNNAEMTVFYATPRDGVLGIYSGTDPLTDKILAVGEAMLGSVVTEFALNPVSINDAGQLAIRIKLANGREMIIRYEP